MGLDDFARACGLGLLCLVPVGSASAAAIQLAPHRAIYALSLDGSKAAKNVEAAQGEIVYEMRGNACNGYTVKLVQRTDLDTDGGGRMTSALSTTTWEDGDANTYRFKIQNTINAEVRDDADGVAERRDGKLFVNATKPAKETFSLGPDVVLPTQHVLKVLTQAEAGDPVLEVPVYDGSSDGKKVYDTLAVIGKAKTATDGLEEAAKTTGLAGRARFPVTISYFERGTSATTPDYVISFDLYDNGVSRALKLDYGDFVLRGQLTSFEALPEEPCAK
jgi:hypothetical protein